MKFYLSKTANSSLEMLFYYPYTIGSHLDKASSDAQNIRYVLSQLAISKGVRTIRIPRVATIVYQSCGNVNFVESIRWSRALTSFYYVRGNFITYTSQRDMPRVHPALYDDRDEDFFKCDNGFKVVSRKVGRREWFNFKNISGDIISDIDFAQVLPFSKDKGMTARGYKPNRTCWMIYPTGRRIQVDESKKKPNKLIIETEQRLKNIISEAVRQALKETLNEKTQLEHRSIGRRKPNRVRNV